MRYLRRDDVVAFSLVYEIESYLRSLVKWEAASLYGKVWVGSVVSEPIQQAIKQRRHQERSLNLFDSPSSSSLAFLNLSELLDLIVGEPLWSKAFSKRFPPRELLEGEFRKLTALRNKLAHFRRVSDRDVDLLRRFSSDLSYWTRPYERISSGRRLVFECGGTGVTDSDAASFGALCGGLRDGWGGAFGSCKVWAVGKHAVVDVGFDLPVNVATLLSVIDHVEPALTEVQVGSELQRAQFYLALASGDDTLCRIGGQLAGLSGANPMELPLGAGLAAALEVGSRDYLHISSQPIPFRFVSDVGRLGQFEAD
jgi:hypothetical protein